tara:strand:- start:312 stop:908 length:597 start_codon:yes stop_codon:yes gene_type:complete
MTMKHLRKLNELASHIAALLVLLAAASFGYSLVEGRINPVMGPLQVTQVYGSEQPYNTIFDGEADKLRDCTWIESRWYIGSRDGANVRTLWDYSGPPKVRREGRLEWQGQSARMSQHDLLRNSFADTVHDCGLPWKTVTPFYEATGETYAEDQRDHNSLHGDKAGVDGGRDDKRKGRRSAAMAHSRARVVGHWIPYHY